jgi:hypothetical protein
MHAKSLAGAGERSPLRAVALTLALTFAALAGTLFTTQTQAHAAVLAPAIAGRVAPFIGTAVADTVAGLFMDQAVGDIDYFHGGNGGTGTGGPGDGASQSPHGKTSRLGRFAELAATVFGMGAFEIGWSLAEGTDLTYADAEASGSPAGGTFSFSSGRCSPTVYVERWPEKDTSTAYGMKATITQDAGTCSNSFVTGGNLNVDGSKGGQTFTVSGDVGSFQTYTLGHTLPGGWLEAYTGSTYCCYVTYSSTSTEAAAETNPALTTTTTTSCSGGGATSTVSSYKPADDTLPHFLGSCPSGETVTGIAQTTVRDSDGATVASPIAPATAPVVPDGYPDCQPLGSCVLTLLRMAPDGQLLANCQGSGACVGWQTQASPNTGTRTRTVTKPDGTTGTEPAWVYSDQTWLDCRYGPYTVPIADCSVVPTEPHGDTTPDTDNCNASDFSFNPVTWVVVPLKCLFIPRQSAVQNVVTDTKTAWDTTPMGVVTAAVDDVFRPLTSLAPDGSDGCEGPLISFSVPTGQTFAFHPLNACSSLAQFVLDYVMPLLTAMTYVTALTIGTRSIMRTIGLDDDAVKT